MSECSAPGCDKPHLARGFCSCHYQRMKKRGGFTIQHHAKSGEPAKWIAEIALPFDDANVCLIWPFAKDDKGYGKIFSDGRTIAASRLVCQIVNGDPPDNSHEAAHSCGRGHRGCVNPRHLRWATHADNMADTILHGTSTRGSRSKSAKLTEADAAVILSMCGKIPQRKIAAIFGVSQSRVSNIFKKTTWKHINPVEAPATEREEVSRA